MKNTLIILFGMLPVCLFAQTYSPNYIVPITITNDSSQTLTDYQVLITYNTLIPISSGHMLSSGNDIRFTTDTCGLTTLFDYWIEDAINTDTTRIWIKIPSIPTGSSEIFMMYGDPGATAASNFTTTFPNAIVTGGNSITLTDTIFSDWVQIDANDTLYIQSGTPLVIFARNVIIDGTVYGLGRGYTNNGLSSIGNGPGGGTFSSNSGAGGGSYGGMGGLGGYDSGDTPGDGGPVYGTINGFDIDMGSAGGSASTVVAGNGGGALTLIAEYIISNGVINLDGQLAQQPGGGQGAGGGSGGGLLFWGSNVLLNSSSFIHANGNGGSIGTSTANDDGGGGGGGRLKFFHENVWVNNSINLVNGGPPGLYGTAAPGEAGGLGTIFDTTYVFLSADVTSIGSENSFSLQPIVISSIDSSYCLNAGNVTLSATPVNGVFSGNGVTGNTFDPQIAGVGSHYIYYTTNCFVDSIMTTVLNIPSNPSASNDSPVCEGSDVNLTSSNPSASHSWNGPGGFNSTLQNPVITAATTTNSGTYTVTITNAVGCTNTATTTVTVIDCSGIDENNVSFQVYPNPTAGWLTINAENLNNEASIQIIDLTGKKVLNQIVQPSTQSLKINLTDFASGIYILRITGDFIEKNIRIIKD